MTPISGDEFFSLANLSLKRTGLPYVVWISPRGDASHDVEVKVSRDAKWPLISVALRPSLRIVGDSDLSPQELALLRRWVDLNGDVLIRYWDGGIEYTEDAIDQLHPIA